MRITNEPTFHFAPEELTYRWLAKLLHDWIVAVAEGPGEFSSFYGNEEGLKDTCYGISDGLLQFIEDLPSKNGYTARAFGALKVFGDNFTTFWRISR
jgi:hypothetical protein